MESDVIEGKKEVLKSHCKYGPQWKSAAEEFCGAKSIRPLGLSVSQVVRFHRKLATRQVLPVQGLMRQFHF